MTSNSDEWRTPEWIWKSWHSTLCFTIDAAATDENKIDPCKDWYTLARSGLDADWAKSVESQGGGSVWCHPPYSRKGGPISRWVEKAISESEKGVVSCMLLPADTSTDWFSLLWDRTAGSWHSGVQGYFTEKLKLLHPETGKAVGSSAGSLIAVVSAPLQRLRSEDEEDSVPDLIIAQDI